MWVTTDGGDSWTLATGSDDRSVQEILALADGTVWAAFEDAVYKSTDHGTSFTRAFPAPGELPTVLGEDEIEYVTCIASNPDNIDEIFAGTAKIFDVFFNRGSVWRTTRTFPRSRPAARGRMRCSP